MNPQNGKVPENRTSSDAVSNWRLNGVEFPERLVSSFEPLVPAVRSQARNVMAAERVPVNPEFGLKRMRVFVSEANSSEAFGPMTPKLSQVVPSVVYCHEPKFVSWPVIAIPCNAPASGSVRLPPVALIDAMISETLVPATAVASEARSFNSGCPSMFMEGAVLTFT